MIYKKRWTLSLFALINTIIFLMGNVLNKKINHYKIYPSDISFSIIFGMFYGFIIGYFILLYLDKNKENQILDSEVKHSINKLEIFNEQLISQNKELESFNDIISDKEKELREIINIVPVQIFLKDIDGNYILSNKAHANFLGFDVEELEGKNQKYLDFFDKNQTDFFKKTDKKVVKENRIYTYEKSVNIDDKDKYLRISKIPLTLSSGEVEILVVAQDMTNINNLKNKIQRQNKRLKKDNQKLSKLNKKNKKLALDFEKLIHLISFSASKEENNEYLKNVFNLVSQMMSKSKSSSIYLFQLGKVKYIDSKKYSVKSLNKRGYLKEDFQMPKKNKVKVLKSSDKFSLIIGFYYGKEVIGGLSIDFEKNISKKIVEQEKRFLRSVSILINNYYLNKKTLEINNSKQKNIIISLVKLLEIHDEYTKGHSEEVARLSQKLAIKMGIENSNSAYWAGMVHDIGKILIDKKILNSKTKLSFSEYETVKNHPLWGYEVLNKSDELKDIAKYILHHHERYDGTGYPEGLKGEEIPQISRILTVTDSWDTMRTKRSYKNSMGLEESIQELIDNKGSQFCPKTVDIFIEEILRNESQFEKDKVAK
ncbi:MAG: HD domain-containing phosphohydrolase [Bacillota bacterium]